LFAARNPAETDHKDAQSERFENAASGASALTDPRRDRTYLSPTEDVERGKVLKYKGDSTPGRFNLDPLFRIKKHPIADCDSSCLGIAKTRDATQDGDLARPGVAYNHRHAWGYTKLCFKLELGRSPGGLVFGYVNMQRHCARLNSL
jgi:hypothetical protein